RVFGEFPKSEPDTFIHLEKVEAAAMREVYMDEDGKRVIPKEAPLEIGVDVARYGDDETTLIPRIGNYVPKFETDSKQDTMTTAGKVIRLAKEMMKTYGKPSCVVKIDDDGVGGGVTDRLREIVQEEKRLYIDVIDCHNGGKAINDENYFNWGSESWA